MLKNSGQEINEEMMTLTQNHILRNLIQDELIWQQTKKYGILLITTYANRKQPPRQIQTHRQLL